jgi:hypothetical protein
VTGSEQRPAASSDQQGALMRAERFVPFCEVEGGLAPSAWALPASRALSILLRKEKGGVAPCIDA